MLEIIEHVSMFFLRKLLGMIVAYLLLKPIQTYTTMTPGVAPNKTWGERQISQVVPSLSVLRYVKWIPGTWRRNRMESVKFHRLKLEIKEKLISLIKRDSVEDP